MKPLPKTVKVLGRTHTVEVVDKDNPELVGCQGSTCFESHEIWIREDMTLERQWEVLLHEIGHNVSNVLLVREDRVDAREAPYNTFMSGLFAVLMDNKWLRER